MLERATDSPLGERLFVAMQLALALGLDPAPSWSGGNPVDESREPAWLRQQNWDANDPCEIIRKASYCYGTMIGRLWGCV